MAELESNHQSTDAIAAADGAAQTPAASLTQSGDPTPDANSTPVTSAQAAQILAELKTIKQNLFWILLLGGFFAARAFFFHY